MSRLRYITPFMRVTDADAAVGFFTNTLGFKVSIRGRSAIRRMASANSPSSAPTVT